MKKIVIIFLFFISASSFARSDAQPKNIIVLFADGVVASQLEFGRYSSLLLRNQPFAVTDVIMSKGQFGLMHTESANYFVTDSAAAASAMSTGTKVNNGAISITPDQNEPPTLMRVAKESGKRIGLVTTAPIYDASPAAFSVHAKKREESEKIVNQYIQLEPDVLLGGGANYFLPKELDGGKRQDSQNAIELFKQKGYQYLSQASDLNQIKEGKVLGLFALEDIELELDRNPREQPNLAEMVSAALKVLSSDSGQQQKNSPGFVLFAENENTDTAGHRNDVASLMRELWAFDDAVKVALEFQNKNPDTLIIVTGDHETGGFAPTYGRKNSGAAGANNYLNVGLKQLKQIEGFKISLQEFADRFKLKIKEGASEKDLNIYLTQLLEENFPGLDIDDDLRQKLITQSQLGNNFNYLPANILGQAIARQTGFYFASSGHTPAPIVVAAMGPGQGSFKGYEDNTQFATKLKNLIGKN